MANQSIDAASCSQYSQERLEGISLNSANIHSEWNKMIKIWW